ncbi:MAG: uracil-DNA glycosylase [Patescibacteria group bacterium]
MDKKVALSELKKEMENDKSLPLRVGATQLVFGEGNPDADLYFLGEGPGFHEDQQGRPFVGQAGKLLERTLESIGLKREDVYISNIVRFRPPENRDPLPEEIKSFQPYVDREIEIINPKVIVTLGRFSMGKFLPGEMISRVHGKPRVVRWKGKDVTIVPMYHPAAALRAGAVMEQFKEDFKRLPEILVKIGDTKEDNNAEQLDLL